jgi:2-dehydro-3-deoxy-D-arabinonate dehydratase
MRIVRCASASEPQVVGLLSGDHAFHRFPDMLPTLGSVLRLHRSELEDVLAEARARPADTSRARLLAPIDAGTEVWAAGVTFKRSEQARVEESSTPDVYARVYTAERPELFFKANARRSVGHDEPIVIRADSTWDVPEAELAVVANAHGEIVAYTICNDVSSRTIEAENPLYLPQAKVWAHSCALGPALVPAWEIADPYALNVRLSIARGPAPVWSGEISMAAFVRRFDVLLEYLFREDEFPDGVVLSTGTGLVPPDSFTLEAGDVVEIEIEGIGVLRNPVVRGKSALGLLERTSITSSRIPSPKSPRAFKG